MKRFLIFLFFIPFVSFGQTKEEIELCAAIQANSFTTDKEAERALNRILSIIGASKKDFVLAPCDKIDNAIATSYKGTRYIFYDREFIKLINQNTNDWSNLLILAHEVGHHIRGHSIDILLYSNDVVDEPTLQKSREMELDADEFAGFVLAKLGATLTEATEAISLISSDKDDTYETHPSKSKRIDAISKGYNNGSAEKEGEITTTYKKDSIIVGWIIEENEDDIPIYRTLSPAEVFFSSGDDKLENGDYFGAIRDYNKAIEFDPDFYTAYSYRGFTKMKLGYYEGAIADYNKAIELNPIFSSERTTFFKKEEREAVTRISSDYYNRGIAKRNLKDYEGAIKDYNEAIKFNPWDADFYFSRGYAKGEIKDYEGAIKDYTKVIELDPDEDGAYNNRAISKAKLKDKNGACEDYIIAAGMGNKNAKSSFTFYCN